MLHIHTMIHLLKHLTIIAPLTSLHGEQMDILVEDGIISQIASNITNAEATIHDFDGAYASIGWMDIGAQVGEPGYEHREDLASVAEAAASGGYTSIACYPNTNPSIHSKSEVLYLKNNTKDSIVDFYPIGAVSQKCEGKDLAELYDMHQAGAIAFSDGKNPIQDAGLMMRGLQYIKAFEGTLINHPHDKSIGNGGQLHEGYTSTILGMKGIPNLCEDLMVQRDIYLAEYTESKVHIANISTARAVDLIRAAKNKNIQVTASVTAMNIAFEDTILSEFDTLYKVLPPLRAASDIKALQEGLQDGTIDTISANHVPLEEEAKNLEFNYADFGLIGLESNYALCNTHLKGVLTTVELVEKLAYEPRRILNQNIPEIAVGAMANLTIFDPTKTWTFTKKDIYSKSKNTPLLGKELEGKVLAVMNNGRLFKNT